MSDPDPRDCQWESLSAKVHGFARHSKVGRVERGGRASAEEIAQNCLLTAWRRQASDSPEEAAKWRSSAYLWGVIQNMAVDALRRAGRTIRSVLMGERTPCARTAASSCDPLDELAMREERERSQARLPQDLREVMALLDPDRPDFVEVGRVLAIPAAVVRSRAARAARVLAFYAAGHPLPPAPTPEEAALLSWQEHLLRIHAAGYDDVEIAHVLHRKRDAVRQFRKAHGLASWTPRPRPRRPRD